MIYLVVGEMGGLEWVVCAYASEELALRHRTLATDAAKRLWDVYLEMPSAARVEIRNPFDKEHCCAGMSDVEYRVEEVYWCDENEWIRSKKSEHEKFTIESAAGPKRPDPQ